MTEQQVQQKPDRKDLKIQALVNKVTKTELENAEYQVELHMANEQLQELNQELMNLRNQLAEAYQQAAQATTPSEPEIVHGEVVEEAPADTSV